MTQAKMLSTDLSRQFDVKSKQKLTKVMLFKGKYYD